MLQLLLRLLGYCVLSVAWGVVSSLLLLPLVFLGAIAAIFKCHHEVFVFGVTRAAWQIELYIYSVCIPQSTLCVPRKKAMDLPIVLWTLAHIMQVCFVRVGSIAMLVAILRNGGFKSTDTARLIVVTIVECLLLGLLMVWLSTWMTRTFFTWLMKDFPINTSREMQPLIASKHIETVGNQFTDDGIQGALLSPQQKEVLQSNISITSSSVPEHSLGQDIDEYHRRYISYANYEFYLERIRLLVRIRRTSERVEVLEGLIQKMTPSILCNKLQQLCNELNQHVSSWRKSEQVMKEALTYMHPKYALEVSKETIKNGRQVLRRVYSATVVNYFESLQDGCRTLEEHLKIWLKDGGSKSSCYVDSQNDSVEEHIERLRSTAASGSKLQGSLHDDLEHFGFDLKTQYDEYQEFMRAKYYAQQGHAILFCSKSRLRYSLETSQGHEVDKRVTQSDEAKPQAFETPSKGLSTDVTPSTGWQSPSSYGQHFHTYGLLSPVTSPRATPTTSDRFSPKYSRATSLEESLSLAYIVPSTTRSVRLTNVDPVHFAAFAPAFVYPTLQFDLAVWAFLVNQREEMVEQATSNHARLLSREKLIKMRRGAVAHVHLEVPEGFVPLNEPTQSIEWTGEVSSACFRVVCAKVHTPGQAMFKATIAVGAQVVVLNAFVIAAAREPYQNKEDIQTPIELNYTLEVLPQSFNEIPFESIKIHELVGSGYFGDAYRGYVDGKDVVVKTIRANDWSGNTDQVVAEFQHEAAVLNMFSHHPHIVPFVGASTDPSSTLCLVTEYLPFGTIEDQYVRGQSLTQRQKTRLVGDIASGVMNMHEGGFIHRDIAARNCLVDPWMRGKVCDFGLCRRVNATFGGSLAERGVGPLKYMAPESLQPPYTFSYKSDVFGFGVLLYETFVERKPFMDLTPHEAAAYVLEGGRVDVGGVTTIPASVQQLMVECFEQDPSKRPSMTDVWSRCRQILQSVD